VDRNRPKWEDNIKADLKWDDVDSSLTGYGQVVGSCAQGEVSCKTAKVGIGGRTILKLFQRNS
jgi:hypothetical protein